MQHRRCSVVMLLAVLLPGVRSARAAAAEADAPPEVAPKLLMAARVGGADDQCLRDVQFRRGRVLAASKHFQVSVTVAPDDSKVEARVSGNPFKGEVDVKAGIPAFTMRRLGPVTYGYRQVHAILQQPYARGPGWTLWGWSHAEAKQGEHMADSRCTYAAAMPNRHLLFFGKCDGGNTVLRCHPKDLSKRLQFPIKFGGGKGTSSFVFEVEPAKGELVRQMVLRGFANAACWDRWHRMMVVGWGLFPSGETFGYADGAGLILVDPGWERVLLKAHVGPKAVFKACAIDSASGLAAAVGYVEDEFREVERIQPRPGAGKDGLVTVWRLWPPLEPAAGDDEAAAEPRSGVPLLP